MHQLLIQVHLSEFLLLYSLKLFLLIKRISLLINVLTHQLTTLVIYWISPRSNSQFSDFWKVQGIQILQFNLVLSEFFFI
jgi:hypothetical protein